MRRYITYTRVKANDSLYLDPNTNNSFENATKDSRFNETPYEVNGVFLASVEYPNNTPTGIINGLIESYKTFNFKFITELQANEYLKHFGFDENNNQYVTVKDFVFTDNRVFNEI